jgi:hypothetical protein
MTGSPGIFPKIDGNTIYAEDYNNIQNTAEFLLGAGLSDAGYGQAVSSDIVSGQPAPDKITVSQWNNLRNDLLKIRQHQTGIDEGPNLTIPTSDDVITNEFVNEYKTFATTCQIDRLTIASNQATDQNLVAPSVRTTQWNGILTQIITVTFPTGDAARHYFNAGGQIRFSASLSHTLPLSDPSYSKTENWSQLLSDMGVISFGAVGTTYTGTGAETGYPKTDLGWYTITTTPLTIFIKPTTPGVYAENDYNISVSKDSTSVADGRILTITIQFRDDDSGDPPIVPIPKGGAPGGVDEPVKGTLTSSIVAFRPTGPNVELPLPPATINNTGFN